MQDVIDNRKGPVIFIPHGGGPLPLMGDRHHVELIDFLKNSAQRWQKPSCIVVISAHWEEEVVTVTARKDEGLLYDYYGFSEASYQIEYPVQGKPEMAQKIAPMLKQRHIDVRLDMERKFDHGVFVPLKLMYPEADIPCVQISLKANLDPQEHIDLGKALTALREQNVLIVGSGSSFHNLKEFRMDGSDDAGEKNVAFEQWLIETCTDADLIMAERERRLVHWKEAPFAEFCHPREEHLLPLHVCYGIAGEAAELVYDGKMVGKQVSAFLWA